MGGRDRACRAHAQLEPFAGKAGTSGKAVIPGYYHFFWVVWASAALRDALLPKC